MSLIKSLSSFYRRNFRLPVDRHGSQSHAFRAPHQLRIAAFHGGPKTKMDMSNAGMMNKTSLPSPPPRSPFYTWAKWAVGTLLTIILPFWDKKWKSLLKLEGEVEMVAEVVEDAAEVVEKVATAAEKIAADAAESLPKDGRLKAAVLFVEQASKEVAEEAHLTQDIIHKVDELKQEVESLIEPIIDIEKHLDGDKAHGK